MSTLSARITSGNDQEDTIDLAALAHDLWGYKWLLLMGTVIGLTFGIFYGLRQAPQYQSNVLLQIESKQGLGSGGGAQQLLLGGGGGDSAATQIALISSRFILEPVVQQLGLGIRVSQKATTVGEFLFPRRHKHDIQVLKFDTPATEANQSYQLLVDKPGYVSLYNHDKQLLLSGPIGKELSAPEHGITLQTQSAETLPVGATFRLTKQPDARVAKNLAASLRVDELGGKNRFGPSTGVLEVTLKGPNKEEVVRILNTLAETTRAKSVQKKAEEASQTLDFLYHQLPITKSLLEKAEFALNQYRAKSGKIDIKMQSQFLLEQLAELDKKLEGLNLKAIEMKLQYKETHPLWAVLMSQIDGVKTRRIELEQTLKKLPAADQVAVNLMRDVEVKQELYMLLLNKIQELEVVKAGTVSGVQILSYPLLPDTALPSKRLFLAMGSSMVGFMLSAMFVFTRKMFFARIDDPHWSEKHLNLPNVAIVPFCKEQVSGALATGKNLSLLAHTHTKNLAIEALRSLRTSLQVTLACANNHVIGILGVAPGVGKSFISANLAYLLAVAGKRVLVIDTDLRKGTLHKYFNLQATPGLTEVLVENLAIEQAARETMHPNLTVLPRGAYPKNPAELLSSEQFKQLIDACAEQFDVVLFDTAPVLLVTDAVIVGALAATNFLVLGSGSHQPSDIEMVFRRLQNGGVHVNGSIFNYHKEQKRNDYYGKYYNYNYAYYHDEG